MGMTQTGFSNTANQDEDHIWGWEPMQKKLIVVRLERTKDIIYVAKDIKDGTNWITEEKRKTSPVDEINPDSDYAKLMGIVPGQTQNDSDFEIDMISEQEFHNYLIKKRMGY